MMNMGEKLSEEECEFLVEEADIDGRSTSSFWELSMSSSVTECTFPGLDYYIPDNEWDQSLQQSKDWGWAGDGSINFEEFVSMMKSAGHYSRVDGSWQKTNK